MVQAPLPTRPQGKVSGGSLYDARHVTRTSIVMVCMNGSMSKCMKRWKDSPAVWRVSHVSHMKLHLHQARAERHLMQMVKADP